MFSGFGEDLGGVLGGDGVGSLVADAAVAFDGLAAVAGDGGDGLAVDACVEEHGDEAFSEASWGDAGEAERVAVVAECAP